MSVALGLGDTPLISLLAGKCIGGSSVLTGAVCFRIPEEVLHVWSDELGLDRMTPERARPLLLAGRRDLPRRRRPHAHAVACDGALRRRRRQARHPDEDDAPKHEGLPRRRALQFRLPQRRKNERRCLLFARSLAARRDDHLRRARREDRYYGRHRPRRPRPLSRRGDRRAARPLLGAREGRRRRMRIDAYAALAPKERARLRAYRPAFDAPSRGAHRRALRRTGQRLGRRASKRLFGPFSARRDLAEWRLQRGKHPRGRLSGDWPRAPQDGQTHAEPRLLRRDGARRRRRASAPLVLARAARALSHGRARPRTALQGDSHLGEDGLCGRRERGLDADFRDAAREEAFGPRLYFGGQSARRARRMHGLSPARQRENGHDAADAGRRQAHGRDLGRPKPLRLRRKHSSDQHRRKLAIADHEHCDDVGAWACRRTWGSYSRKAIG